MLRPPGPERYKNFTIRVSESDQARAREIATAHDWTLSKTIQKLVVAGLDAKAYSADKHTTGAYHE